MVLDTHAWIWWVTESPKVSRKARRAINEADGLGVHPISCWEVAMLVAKGRLALSLDVAEWVIQALRRPKIRLLPFPAEQAVLATRLPGDLHADPADRFIVAACLAGGLPLVTKDEAIRAWGHVETVW
ncbi:MAG TPA: type II toxin-antitoxin system VapC family toxin [bacterium]|jgi:PIN domain nuclease of toxin-antitoxin system